MLLHEEESLFRNHEVSVEMNITVSEYMLNIVQFYE